MLAHRPPASARLLACPVSPPAVPLTEAILSDLDPGITRLPASSPPELIPLCLQLPGHSSQVAASMRPLDRPLSVNGAFSTRDLSRLLINSLLQPGWSACSPTGSQGGPWWVGGGDKGLLLGSHRTGRSSRLVALLHGSQRWTFAKTPFLSKAASLTPMPLCAQTPDSPP